jgi:hypothetical protein
VRPRLRVAARKLKLRLVARTRVRAGLRGSDSLLGSDSESECESSSLTGWHRGRDPAGLIVQHDSWYLGRLAGGRRPNEAVGSRIALHTSNSDAAAAMLGGGWQAVNWQDQGPLRLGSSEAA